MKIGNNNPKASFGRQKDKQPTLKDYNDAWSTVRRRSIQKTQALAQEVNQSVFSANVSLGRSQASQALQGNDVSLASAMSRLNILV